MDRESVWKNLFHHWPAALPRKGVLVAGGEQTPFQEFMTMGDLLLVQRRAPDTVGARDVIIPFSEITALKVTEVIKLSTYAAAGFEGAAKA